MSVSSSSATSLSFAQQLKFSFQAQSSSFSAGPTKDQLIERQQKLKAEGKDTSNLDKIIKNFDQLSTDGKLDIEKLKSQAKDLGIKLPKGHHHPPKASQTDAPPENVGPPPPPPLNDFGPPPGFFDEAQNNENNGNMSMTASLSFSFQIQIFQQSSQLNNTDTTSNVNLAA